MVKLDLKDCSIVIPVRIDFPERLEHVNALLRYFPQFFKNYELIIVEQGKEPQVKSEAVLFVQTEEEFSTSQLSNIGAEHVKTPYFCKCDADACIDPRAIFEAFEKLKADSSLSLVLPYNGVSYTVQSPLREELIQSLNFRNLPLVQPRESLYFDAPHMILKNSNSKGLIHHFRTSVFKQLGGYNEEFIGWGYEDDEVLVRFEKLGHPPTYL